MKDKNTKCCGGDCGNNCNSESCCDDNCGKDCCSETCCSESYCDNERISESCYGQKKISGCGACNGGIYGLAFLGALIYYIQHAETFWMGVLGVLKALVWPAVLIYKLLELLAK